MSRSRLHQACLLLALIGVAPASQAGGEQEHPSCSSRPEVEDSLDALALDAFDCRPDKPCWERRLAALEELRSRFPRDVHVHRAYQNAARPTRSEGLIDDYRARLEQEPGDPLWLYLVARLASGDERTSAAEAALAADTGYPWAHLVRLAAYLRQEPPRPAEAFELLQTFMRLCPESVAPVLAYAGRLGEPEYWRERLPELRQKVTRGSVAAQLLTSRRLWSLEFQVTPPLEHARVREQVRRDLERLDSVEVEAEAVRLDLLAHGWELVGDAERLVEVHLRQSALDPCSSEVTERTLADWAPAGGGPRKIAEMSPEQVRELYDASSGWVELCPDSFAYWTNRMGALAGLEGIEAETVLAEVERYLAVWEPEKEWIGVWASPYRKSAELLLDHRVGLERVPALIEQERAYVHKRRDERGEPPESMRAQIEEGNFQRDLEIDLLTARAELALGKTEVVSSVLPDLEARVAELAAMPETGHAAAPSLRAALFSLRAELALAEGRPPPDAGGEAPRTAVAISGWREVDEALAPFELVDLAGRTWTRDDLAGRTVLVNLWATWCGPCRLELPYLERLRQSLEGEDDLWIVTFNVDRNPGLIAPYLEQEGIGVDVLLAERHIRDEMGGFAIPLNWIVDPASRIRRRQSGFSVEDAELWLDEARRAMEAVRAGAQ